MLKAIEIIRRHQEGSISVGSAMKILSFPIFKIQARSVRPRETKCSSSINVKSISK
jgi:hypothetical protein